MPRGKSAQSIVAVGILLSFAAVVSAAPAGRAQGDDAGQKLFQANCVGCHGDDGSGTDLGKSLMAPDLRTDEVQMKSDDDIRKQISEGKNSMPPFKDTLTPDQITSVIKYVRTFAKKK